MIGWLGEGLGPTASGVRGEGGMTGYQGKTCGCVQLCEIQNFCVCFLGGGAWVARGYVCIGSTPLERVFQITVLLMLLLRTLGITSRTGQLSISQDK